jgi:hypothetical protein
MSQQLKSTPGPWLIHAKHRWIVPAEDAFREPDDALPICQLRDPDDLLTEDQTLANGFLIAAAPELYEALYNIIDINDEADTCMGGLADCLDGGNGPVQSRELQVVIELSRSVLAKARGQ